MDFLTVREIFSQSFQKGKENVIRMALEFTPSMTQCKANNNKKCLLNLRSSGFPAPNFSVKCGNVAYGHFKA